MKLFGPYIQSNNNNNNNNNNFYNYTNQIIFYRDHDHKYLPANFIIYSTAYNDYVVYSNDLPYARFKSLTKAKEHLDKLLYLFYSNQIKIVDDVILFNKLSLIS